MATQAAKTMLFQTGKPFPSQLLRGSLLLAGVTNTNAGITRLITDPITKSNPGSLIISQHFLGLQSDISDLNWQFCGFAEMGRMEARGKKTVADDSEEDSDDSDGGDEEYDDVEDDSEDYSSNDGEDDGEDR